jgi:hypothetical protein
MIHFIELFAEEYKTKKLEIEKLKDQLLKQLIEIS